MTQNFVYTEKPQVFEFYPQYYHKTDKDGRPVYIEQLGKIDLTKLAKITTDDRMLQNLVVEYEKLADPRLPACSRKSGVLLETCCTISKTHHVALTNLGTNNCFSGRKGSRSHLDAFRVRISPASLGHITKLLPRKTWKTIHHQRPMGFLRRLQCYQEVFGPSHRGKNPCSRIRIRERLESANSSGEPPKAIRWNMCMCWWLRAQ